MDTSNLTGGVRLAGYRDNDIGRDLRFLFNSIVFSVVPLLSGVSCVLQSDHPSGSVFPVSEDPV